MAKDWLDWARKQAIFLDNFNKKLLIFSTFDVSKNLVWQIILCSDGEIW